MSKTLNTIQTIMKVARVLAKIMFVIAIVGAVGSVFGLGALIGLGAENLHGIIQYEGSIEGVYSACAIAIVSCVAQIVLSRLAIKYFNNEIAAGTPFTFDGAKELFRLGVINIAVSLGASFLSALIVGILWVYFPGTDAANVEGYASIGTGLFMMFISSIFKYGAEVASPAFEDFDGEKERIKF